MRLLFISHQGKKRSKKIESLFRNDYKTLAAGLYSSVPVTSEQLHWADRIFVMRESQKEELKRRFPEICAQKKIINLDIPSFFSEEDQEMVELIKKKISHHLN